MRIILNGASVAKAERTAVRYSGTTADPVPTCNLSIYDETSALSVAEMQELLILDDVAIPYPTINLVQGPTLASGDASKWYNNPSGGSAPGFSWGSAPPVTSTFLNNTGTGLQSQDVRRPTLTPGQSYMLSCSIMGNLVVNGQYVLEMQWMDAGANILQTNIIQDTPPAAFTRLSLSGVCPAGTAYVTVSFGASASVAGNNSGQLSFENIQFEPVWFSDISYPTPWCGPNQTNCRLLANLNLYIRQYRKFAGWVTRAKAGNYHGNARTWAVTASGYAWILDTIYTNKQYINRYDSYIISDLLNSYLYSNAYLTTLFTTTNVVQGVQLANLQANWDSLKTIINGLAGQSGFFWTVDPYWNFVYQPPGYNTMPIALICDASANPDMSVTYPAYRFEGEIDFTQPGCAALVIGTDPGTTTTTTALTSGLAYTSVGVNAIQATVLSGTQLLIGAGGSADVVTLSAQANVGDTSISFTGHTMGANHAVGSRVTIPQNSAQVIDPARSDTLNHQALYDYGVIGNVFARKVVDSTLASVSDVTQRGVAEILQYDEARDIYHLSTNAELLIGQGIQVTSSTDGLNATTLLIQQVSASYLGKNELLADVWEYQADLGAVNRAATNILSRIFRRTTALVAPVTITNVALVVLEKFGLFDLPQYPYPLAVLADVPTGYWRFGEGAGLLATDSSGNGYNGSINASGVTLSEPGAIAGDPNTSFLFDGAAGFVQTLSGSTPTGWSALSLEAWIRLPSASFTGFPRIFSCDYTQSDNKGCELLLQNNGAGITLNIGNGATFMSITGFVPLAAGVWYHVVAAWSASGSAYLYLNGVQIASGSLSGTIGAPTNLLSIGYNPALVSNYFPGYIDEAAIYQAQLSASRVAKHYSIGSTGRS